MRKIFTLWCLTVLSAYAQDTVEAPETKLENVRNQIEEVKSSIEQARRESEIISEELQNTEMAISEISLNLDAMNNRITEAQNKLHRLNGEKVIMEENLSLEQSLLANQVRAAYHAGRNNYIKLLLNQENPEIIGRMLVYYDYFNEARARRISGINSTINDLEKLKIDILNETATLNKLKAGQESRLDDLFQSQQQRESIIARLEGFISEQDIQLDSLIENAEELESLINDLQQEDSVVHTFKDIPPFSSLKGQLNWPVSGRINNKFGSTRKDGKLKWQGLNIVADKGSRVSAISPGRVIYADWFRNMGLLIIIDHGGGYMSLYGHNERLMKKEGDWVFSDEEIARVGDTGGQDIASLYFEIRYEGNPVDPDTWCSL